MKSVLITGGSGFFGHAFARRCLVEGYTRVCIYSRNEFNQFKMREAFEGDDRMRWFIGDIRDKERLHRALTGIDAVVHGAALKRIEIGQYAPDEMVKTNVIGALNLIDAAASAGVKKVVALSTDKAWQGGISPYGQTKALAESMFLNANNIFGEHGPKYSIVRYGNIWRSKGSVVPTWEAMIAAGAKEVSVTDPDCTRFMMLIEEAVELVMNTINEMKGGELVVPDWLPAYRLGDLADAMGVSMLINGLPAWERKHEGMRDGCTSDQARRMSVAELRELLKHA